MSLDVWDALLSKVKDAHVNHPDLQQFCPFPTDVEPQDVIPFDVPAAQLFKTVKGLDCERYQDLCDACFTAGPHAHWRETYKETDIGQDFMDRFGVFCLIGDDGAFASAQMRAWIVFMPPHLYYPWHQHPADEMYLVVGGEASFLLEGSAPHTLAAGKAQQHTSNQSHAMQTFDHPVMAYVIWRNQFDTPPVWTARDELFLKSPLNYRKFS